MTYRAKTESSANIVHARDMHGDETDQTYWDERIENAIEAVASGGWFGKVILPSDTSIKITKPIRLYRSTVYEGDGSGQVDLRGNSITNWNDVREHWEYLRNGAQTHLAKRITLEGESRSTNVYWYGNSNGVMLDMPSPMETSVKSIRFHGNHLQGHKTLGIRIRPGWEFQQNTARNFTIEDCYFTRLYCAIYVGDPFSPDLTTGIFDNIWTWGCLWGAYLQGANVTGIEFRSAHIQQYDYAGFYCHGSSGTDIRTPTEIAANPTLEANDEPGSRGGLTTRDFFNYEYSTADLLNTKNDAGSSLLLTNSPLTDWSPQQEEEPPEGWTVDPAVTGGGPDLSVYSSTGSSANPFSYYFKIFRGRVWATDVRIENCTHMLLHWHDSYDVHRLTSRLTNVSGATSNGVGDANGIYVAKINGGRDVYLYGCFFEGPVHVNNNCPVHDLGTRWGDGTTSNSGQCLIEQDDDLPLNGWAVSGVPGSAQRTSHDGNLACSNVVYTGGAMTPGWNRLSGDMYRWTTTKHRHRKPSSDFDAKTNFGNAIFMNPGATNKSVYLPTAESMRNQWMVIQDIGAGAGDVVIDPDGTEQIDGSSTKTISGGVVIYSDGTEWRTIATV